MSDVSVDIIKNRSGEAPDLPSGANLSGVSTAATLQVTNLNPTHINASGVTTATTFSGSLKSTGTPTLGLGVTINSSGLNISGVATAGIVSATTLYGDGSNLTGIAMSIAPISYQPDVNDTLVTRASGGVSIGMTFTERVIAGSGNVTLRLVGAAGTVVENFGVGSSVTIANNTVLVTPTAALIQDTVYHISYPSGAFTNTAGDVSYVGTAYTFAAAPTEYQLWAWGRNLTGQLGQNSAEGDAGQYISSPVQVPGVNWRSVGSGGGGGGAYTVGGTKTDGTFWMWGDNEFGCLGDNTIADKSSPVQLAGTTWTDNFQSHTAGGTSAVKTDGTLWVWGKNQFGQLGQNSEINYSSPVQIPGTTWSTAADTMDGSTEGRMFAIKTDGTLWSWGIANNGNLGLNDHVRRSSPTQIPGTTWSNISISTELEVATKTDGTLWTWGVNTNGQLGQNESPGSPATQGSRSSPVQIPGTTWSTGENKIAAAAMAALAIKTNGTLWAWGAAYLGTLGQNETGAYNSLMYSSPVQIPGTTWSTVTVGGYGVHAMKTDGTLWSWGYGGNGQLAQNNRISYSSPVQIPGTDWSKTNAGYFSHYAIKEV